MTTRLTFLCHAPTAATRSAAFPRDESLEPRALQRLLSKPRKLTAYDHAWASPAARAAETANALAIVALPEALLRDCAYGSWAGRTLAEVQACDSEGFAGWLDDPNAAPHGGESLSDVAIRVGSWLRGCQGRSERILAITHAAVIKAAVVQAIGAPLRSTWRIDIAPLSVTRLTGRRNLWTLASLNESLESALKQP